MAFRVTRAARVSLSEISNALQRASARTQNAFLFEDKVSKHRRLVNLFDKYPDIATECFVAPSATVVGDVKISDRSSVWYNAVIRGDLNSVRIGAYTNIQDGTSVLTSKDNPHGIVCVVDIGDFVTIGQGCTILGGTSLANEVFIGMGSVIGEGCVIGQNSVLAPGTVLLNGTNVPSGQFWSGNPGVFVRDLTKDEKEYIGSFAEKYYGLTLAHAGQFLPYGTSYVDLDVLRQKFSA